MPPRIYDKTPPWFRLHSGYFNITNFFVGLRDNGFLAKKV